MPSYIVIFFFPNYLVLITFSPHGTAVGLTMGAKAEQEVNMPGFLR